MGAENSILHDCEWGETYQNEPWEIENGRLSNGDEISLFRLRPKDRQNNNHLTTLTQQLKSLRHPYILHYVGFEETADGPCLITEKVTPLEVLLPKMSSTEICAGLQNILEGLEFLHDRAKICHNNLYAGCLYVSGDGSWRLGGLEHACHFSAVTQALLNSSKKFREEDTLTPEELEDKVLTDVEYGHARDIYAFAVMTDSLLEKLTDLGDLTKTFELRIQEECLNSDPKQRPKVVSLLQDRLFSAEFLQIASFLKLVALRSELERKEFFKSLLPKLRCLPENLIGQRLVPSLLSRFVMLDPTATEHVLPSVLVPRLDNRTQKEKDCDRPLLDEVTFKQFVIPRLVRIFSVRDFHIHLTLLKYFKYFVHLIDHELLELDVFPHVLLGLRDTSNDIASLSLHALAEMVPLLGRDVIIGGQSKPFFKEGMPKQNTGSHPTINNIKENRHGKKSKLLLKDMAKYSENHVEEEKDNKAKEREKKREEMKMRREERKLQREKAKLKNKEIQALNITRNGASETAKTSTSDENPESQKFHNQSDIEEADLHSPNRNQSDEEMETISPELHLQHSDTESFSAETKNTHEVWDGWAEKGDDSVESDISDEIEKELQNMSVESGSVSSNVRVKSPKLAAKTSKTVLKLVPKKTKTDVKRNDNEAVISELEKSVQNLSPKYNKSSSSKVKAKNTGKKTDLGSEFDIKTIDIKVQPSVEDPFDFFSGMTPKIESKNVSDILKDAGRNLDEPVTTDSNSINQASKISFDVMGSTAEVADIEGGGWEDEDW